MSEKKLPIGHGQMLELASHMETPFYLYDETAIIEHARRFRKLFAWAPGFCNYYAVKACPNPAILKLLAQEGFGADCSSLPELLLSKASGITGKKIMFTSNDTPPEEFKAAYEAGAIINLDDITHIEALEQAVGTLPDTICFRYNPGPDRTGNAIIGNPVEAKYGVTTSQIVDCYKIMKEKGVKHFGLHTMVASNELDGTYIVETARMLFDLAIRIQKEAGVRIEFIDMGGGIGIPYRPDQEVMDLAKVSSEMQELYQGMIVPAGLDPLQIVFECGRVMTGPYGYLVSKVLHVTKKYKDYVGLDASMANLMRPALYGSYHHITVVGKDKMPCDHTYDVTGSLCENNDKFAIDRKLPEVKKGDVVVIHDAGAHGHSMGFNYNGKLRCAEYMLKRDGSVVMIRKAQTCDDYFSTLRFDGAEVVI
ncbi:MAG: diaminopimelate decarboxylase [Sphaerochaeta sp.]|jgi:diaminopimelate decarboxylase|uniref:diaminopimelate decarboxylase n=1 Tax=Sphaerochaeta TaxID=399320 RepID=UPI002590570F|nr:MULTISPECIES: diaminopimelate decarboxylase [Sphaerochaeta]MDD2395781.1 diaminopimelate decarboxylase [Sphaerochaeta sp.]MDD3424331.1 diaminopimelate decarboxylase [Sphaerochaeta sp.]MDD4038172.1 diaminopimelate decarboxylase [Sphaerochaeta sp.]MDD4450463.1 diaminopimelate decarboxylase [Sphaerochaeta sp.]MDX9985218.1 diaminopimelate decarboxylase [Sphaerochaeta sp.]